MTVCGSDRTPQFGCVSNRKLFRFTATNFDAPRSHHKILIGEKSEARVRSVVNVYNGYLGLYKTLDTSVFVQADMLFDATE